MRKEETMFFVHVEMERWLRQWLLHHYGTPQGWVEMPRLSVENKVLETSLISTPPSSAPNLPTDESVAILIPAFRHKPACHFNYLPRLARKELKRLIRDRFIIQLWDELHHYGHIGKRRDHLIYDFMERNGIEPEETSWNAIAKIYLRQRRNYYERERYRKNVRKN